jgi:hypothetical protein
MGVGWAGLNPETYLRDPRDRIAESHPISWIDKLMSWHIES